MSFAKVAAEPEFGSLVLANPPKYDRKKFNSNLPSLINYMITAYTEEDPRLYEPYFFKTAPSDVTLHSTATEAAQHYYDQARNTLAESCTVLNNTVSSDVPFDISFNNTIYRIRAINCVVNHKALQKMYKKCIGPSWTVTRSVNGEERRNPRPSCLRTSFESYFKTPGETSAVLNITFSSLEDPDTLQISHAQQRTAQAIKQYSVKYSLIISGLVFGSLILCCCCCCFISDPKPFIDVLVAIVNLIWYLLSCGECFKCLRPRRGRIESVPVPPEIPLAEVVSDDNQTVDETGTAVGSPHARGHRSEYGVVEVHTTGPLRGTPSKYRVKVSHPEDLAPHVEGGMLSSHKGISRRHLALPVRPRTMQVAPRQPTIAHTQHKEEKELEIIDIEKELDLTQENIEKYIRTFMSILKSHDTPKKPVVQSLIASILGKDKRFAKGLVSDFILTLTERTPVGGSQKISFYKDKKKCQRIVQLSKRGTKCVKLDGKLIPISKLKLA